MSPLLSDRRSPKPLTTYLDELESDAGSMSALAQIAGVTTAALYAPRYGHRGLSIKTLRACATGIGWTTDRIRQLIASALIYNLGAHKNPSNVMARFQAFCVARGNESFNDLVQAFASVLAEEKP